MTSRLRRTSVAAITSWRLLAKTCKSLTLNRLRTLYKENVFELGSYINLNAFYQSEPNASQRFDIQMVAKFSDHNCTVWRTAWNVTGTMLASTGDDGYVRMWKSEL